MLGIRARLRPPPMAAWSAAVALVGTLVAGVAGTPIAGAEPNQQDPGASPYPDIRYYDKLDPLQFAQPGGIWFIAPTGQNCGIWGLGSFGCAGNIPGAPPGVSHIGWIDGDRAVHYDWSMDVRFPATAAVQVLAPRSSVTHEGTTCAATPDGRTYCERGPLRFVIEADRTWLSPPWMDLSWIELGPASCSPPGGGPCYS
ncbi:hypothetical protein MANY_42140 [Mycolicibacterium anyangense]|uniref:Uncharacterized protein n=1 Tax=Mycolicibacterium anyangense TaxID=1431246 RepID=A0A6N4WFC7_9MYCO|nr:hypothetical protein [Mycolicibacterium anyangense]BBZ78877.1 hypothetical protein MANY_42140 [Mycolicibacterium anyangense]